MECSVRWSGEGMSFIAETGSKHLVAMDGAPDGGGRNLAPRPMEMVLVGTGGCTAYDVVVILKKSGQEVTGCEVKLTSERAETDPKVFTRIHMHFVVRGRALKGIWSSMRSACRTRSTAPPPRCSSRPCRSPRTSRSWRHSRASGPAPVGHSLVNTAWLSVGRHAEATSACGGKFLHRAPGAVPVIVVAHHDAAPSQAGPEVFQARLGRLVEIDIDVREAVAALITRERGRNPADAIADAREGGKRALHLF